MNQWIREFVAANESILAVIFFVPVLVSLYTGAWLLVQRCLTGFAQ